MSLKENPETSRVGTKWTIEEDNMLNSQIENSWSYEDIALEHKRNILGIKSRVISKIIYPKIKLGTSILELAKIYNIEISLINKYIEKNLDKNEKQNNKNLCNLNNSNMVLDTKISILEIKLNEINNKLDLLLSKI